MGRRGEIFSSRLLKEKRTYFFNVHENFGNSLSLSIVESKNTTDEKVYQRQSILVFQEDLDEFLMQMQKAVDVMRMEGARPDREEGQAKGQGASGREVVIGEINKKPSSDRIAARSSSGHGASPQKKRIVIRIPKDE